MRTSRTCSPGATRISPVPVPGRRQGREAAPPLCGECEDGEPTADRACPECPRCSHCEQRLAESPEFALLAEGWEPWCSAGCLQSDTEGWSRPARAALALSLLEASAAGALDAHPQQTELLGFCHAELAGALRALLVRPRASERGASEAVRWNPHELALLAGETSAEAVVDRVCSECDAPVDRFVDPLGGNRRAANARDPRNREIGLCDWHAHVEALRIVQRRQPARSVRPGSDRLRATVSSTSGPARSA